MLPVFEPGMGCAKGWAQMDHRNITQLMRSVTVNTETGCWESKKKLNAGGYGTFQMFGKNCLMHRVSYELLRGRIPTGLDLDHLCRNRACCNPEHLEPVTKAENTRRARVATEKALDRLAMRCKHKADSWENDSKRCMHCIRESILTYESTYTKAYAAGKDGRSRKSST